jgi:hypothetical protein
MAPEGMVYPLLMSSSKAVLIPKKEHLTKEFLDVTSSCGNNLLHNERNICTS